MKRDELPSLSPPVAVVAGPAPAWRYHVVALALVVAWLIATYWHTAVRIVEIWYRSATFAHGFVVPLISGWLIWRARDSWKEETPAVSPIWLVAVFLCGLAWLCGEAGTVNALSQLAFVAMLVSVVPAVLGTTIARRIAFPLAFLFFAVPIGEFMLPALMQWTADFTVFALRLTGVPVYREGQEIVIPSGRWSVVEACSGIRYLIASLMVGTLYAYVCFASFRRRLLFIGAAILIPIVANWVRAYMIVMIGHLSNNKLAVGVDHLIYGWLFFGFVMFVMFWAGSFWRDDVPPVGHPAMPNAVPVARSRWSSLVVALVVVFSAIGPIAWHAIGTRIAAAGGVTLDPIRAADGWVARPGVLAAWAPEVESASAAVRQTFASGGREVGLDVAYFRDQSSERKLVSSTNVLGGSGLHAGTAWAILDRQRTDVLLGGRSFSANQSTLLGPGNQRLVALQWYWIDGLMTAHDVVAKLYTFLSRIQGRDDAAMIVVYARQSPTARQSLDDFLRDNGAALQATLQRAAASR